MWAVLENHPDTCVKCLLANGAPMSTPQTNVSVTHDGHKPASAGDSADIGHTAPGYTGRAPAYSFGAMTPYCSRREGNLEGALFWWTQKRNLERPSAMGTRPLAVAITTIHPACNRPARRRTSIRWCDSLPEPLSIIPPAFRPEP